MKVITETVTVTKPVQVEQAVGVSLDLTIEEYATLRVILGQIGGHPDTTLRGHVDSIAQKMSGGTPSPHDIAWNKGDKESHTALFLGDSRSIYFAQGSNDSSLMQEAITYYKENLK